MKRNGVLRWRPPMRLPGRREPRAAGCDHSVIKAHAVKPFPATMTRQIVFGAACWALSIAFFVNQAIVQAASARPYSLATNYISDLGNTACGSYSAGGYRSEEHTSELQSLRHLVCRLLLEKRK